MSDRFSEVKCPKCGGELSKWESDWTGTEYRCEGFAKEPKDERFGNYHWKNRTTSCGWFEPEELGLSDENEK